MAAAVAVLVAGAHSVAWWAVTDRIRSGLGDFTVLAAQDGWRIETGPATRVGWPLHAGMQLPAVVATRDLGGAVLRWTADRVEVSVSPFDSAAVLISAEGRQSLQVGPGTMSFHADRTVLRIQQEAGTVSTLDLQNLIAGDDAAGLKAARIALRIGDLAVGINVDDVQLSPPLAPPFERGFAASAALVLNHALPRTATPHDSAAAWQALGGRLTVPAVMLRWSTLTLTGSGSGWLDARMQPTGRAALQVQGAEAVVDAALSGGVVAPGPAAAVRAVLGLLAMASPDKTVNLPVVLEDSILTVAQFPLLKLPALDFNFP